MKRAGVWGLILGFVFLLGVRRVEAVDHPRLVLFINQVRGSECCDAGSVEHLQFQLTSLQKYQLPATFAVRFDALHEPAFVRILRPVSGRHELAGLLEITPSLAQAADVPYRGDTHNWYRAQHVFLVGYNPDERIRLIDTYMRQFRLVFGEYPTTTVAWMIDAASLSYLKAQYGVKVHEITREQWGTDSYTLYGGPEHYPYIASDTWPLIPDSTNASGVLMLRQTVDDPMYAYGDTTSAFTTQPNDYVRDRKDFSYFETLAETILHQDLNRYSMALLGLENNMEMVYQEAFAEQMEWVKKRVGTGEVQVLTPRQFVPLYPQLTQAVTVVAADDTVYGEPFVSAWWINASNYRVRVVQQKTSMAINDVRLYSTTVPDPYAATASATANGYWVVPYTIDASRPPLEAHAAPAKLPWWLFWKPWLFPPPVLPDYTYGMQPGNDIRKSAFSWELPPISEGTSPTVTRNGETITFAYSGEKGAVTLVFDPHTFSVSPLPKRVPINQFSRWWGLTGKNDGNTSTYTPYIVPNLDWTRVRAEGALFLDPENASRRAIALTSEVEAYNAYAIAGRNPVRLFIYPRDENRFPTLPGDIDVVSGANEYLVVSLPQASHLFGPVYVDVASAKPHNTTLTVCMDGQRMGKVQVAFAPDCLKQKAYCLTHPRGLWNYALTKIFDRMRKQ